MLETLLQPDETHERCGLVLRDGTVVEIQNIAQDPKDTYEMCPLELLPHVQADAIAETWHTHPQSDPALSGADYEGFLAWPHFVHNIIGRRNGEVLVLRYKVEDGLVIACD